jgi:hypothetical protein
VGADGAMADAMVVNEEGIEGAIVGERIELGETTDGDVVLICRADRSKSGLSGTAHFREIIVGRRASSLTSTDDALLRAEVDHVTGSDGSYRTVIDDTTPLSPRRHEWIYCDVAGVRWLAIRQVGTSTDNPIRNAIWYLIGHRPRDEVGAFTVVAAASISNVTLVQAHSGNTSVNKALNNVPVLTQAMLADPRNVPGVPVVVAWGTAAAVTGVTTEQTVATFTLPAA